MPNRNIAEAFDVARQAMDSLQLFRAHYGSTQEYQVHQQQVVEILRKQGGDGAPGHNKFLKGFADLVEAANALGVWPGLARSE